jgi:hypothetical protein
MLRVILICIVSFLIDFLRGMLSESIGSLILLCFVGLIGRKGLLRLRSRQLLSSYIFAMVLHLHVGVVLLLHYILIVCHLLLLVILMRVALLVLLLHHIHIRWYAALLLVTTLLATCVLIAHYWRLYIKNMHKGDLKPIRFLKINSYGR